MDSAPTSSPAAACIENAVFLATANSSSTEVIPAGTVLPVQTVLKVGVTQPKGYFKLLTGPESGAGSLLAEVVFEVDASASGSNPVPVDIIISISETGSASVSVQGAAGILISLEIP